MAKTIINKLISLSLLILICLIPICAVGFIWFDWLLIVKIEGSLLWLALCAFVAFMYFSKDEVKIEENEQ